MRKLFIDIETYSPIDISESGSYKYIESPDFEILLIGYAINDGPVITIDLAQGEAITEELEEALFDPDCLKIAHNATFERRAFMRIGYDIPIEQWYCTMVKAAYCGLPLSLDQVSKVLDLENKKLDTGKALIRYFSCPCKPTKINGGRTRNYPMHDYAKWNMYIEYNRYDVLSEREIFKCLEPYKIPDIERRLYVLDQQINDAGIMIDLELANSAIYVDNIYTEELTDQAKALTDLENPNSTAQIKKWIEGQTGSKVDSLNKAVMEDVMDSFKDKPEVIEVLNIRKKLSKTSIKKYYAMINCAMSDNRARGMFQFYGANRTGRWAGRLIQLQNLARNHIDNIGTFRELLRNRDIEGLEMMCDDIPDVLSQLIRTAFVAPEGKLLAVADFSAIEARVISWIADEEWRMEVFRGDGKIYEATGSKMFNVPISAITKGSELRQKSKISELALGYEGALGALKRMGGDRLGLSNVEMMSLVRKWREANPSIVDLWKKLDDASKESVRYHRSICVNDKLLFETDDTNMTIKLPSGRKLFYRHPSFANKQIKGNKSLFSALEYEGIVQETKQWGKIDTYGGKLTENCLASGTIVITNNGLKTIETITNNDLIWDGYEYVKHDGLINKGEQLVISINGIYITPDHKILTSKGWRTCNESEGLNWAEVSLPYGYKKSRKQQIWKSSMAMSMRLRKQNSCSRGRIRTNKKVYYKVLRLYEKFFNIQSYDNTWHDSPSGFRGMACNEAKMRRPKSQSLSQLWRPRNKSMQGMEQELRSFLARYGFNLQGWIRIRQNKQRGQLRKGQLPLDNTKDKLQQSTQISNNKYKRRSYDCRRILKENRVSKIDNTLSAKSQLANRIIIDSTRYNKQVWDIMNCGSRNQFCVIEPYTNIPRIVHNCTQGIARDLLANSMLNIVAAGYNIVGHIHDEVIVEVPKENAKEHYNEVVRVMSIPPDWAKDIPLNADGYITPFYLKD